MKLSVVSTLYGSSPHLREFHSRMSKAAAAYTDDYEIVFVNDGSPDDSIDVALDIFQADPHVRVVDLSKNFGHHKAMMTGLSYARGEQVFLIDCDLEEPPETLATFVEEQKKAKADVVYGVQPKRKGAAFERFTGWVYYGIYNALSPEPIPRNLITARLMSGRYVKSLLEHREREMHIAGLWVTTGYKQVPLTIAKASKGSSTYSFARRVSILVSAITAFSNLPLIWIFYLGSTIIALSLLAAAYLVIRVLFFGALLAGWASLFVSIWLLGGITIFCVGLIGIYLSKVFIETKQRPYTVVRALHEHAPE